MTPPSGRYNDAAMSEATVLSRDLLQKVCLEAYPQDHVLEPVLKDFVDVAKQITGSDYGSIFVMEREDDEVRLVAHREEGELLDDLPNLLQLDTESPGIVTWVYHNNQTYMSNDVSQDPYYFPAFKEVQADLVVPIRLQGEAIGVISVESRERGHYTEEHRQSLEEFAEAISLVIARLWLSRYSRRRGYNVEIIGVSRQIRQIEELVKRVARTREPVLLTGDSGVGKELLAHAIHYFSPRRERDMLIVNCGAFAEELLASELFGHVKGAFTGAHRDKAGKMELAHHGTLFLDEVEAMSARLQVLLLRALENGEIQKVGEDRAARRVDVRIIAASNRDLRELVDEGSFREDLYYRFNVFGIHVPALRERREDIPLLAEHFLREFVEENQGGPEGFTAEAMRALKRYAWPGNVRELRNAVRRAAVLADGKRCTAGDLPPNVVAAAGIEEEDTVLGSRPAVAALGDLSLDAVVARHLRLVLDHVGGNKTKAAEVLGIPRTSLYHKLRKYGIGDGDED
jgi:transcriptional regulator with GAF, ATPase, and Fis domain